MSITTLLWGSPAAADTQSIGSPFCSPTGGSNNGALTFTFGNSGTSYDYYNITVGPHGHGFLSVGSSGRSFTLKGIPDGTHSVNVKNLRTGNIRFWIGQTFNCSAPQNPYEGDSGTIAFSCDGTRNGSGRVRFSATNGSLSNRDGYQFKLDSSNVGAQFGLGARRSHPDTRSGILDGTRVIARITRTVGNQTKTLKLSSHTFSCAPVLQDTVAISTACIGNKARINFSARNNGTTRRSGYRFEFNGVKVGVPFSLSAGRGHADYTGDHNGFPAGVGDGTFTARIYRGSLLLRQRTVTITCAPDVLVRRLDEQRPAVALTGGRAAFYGIHLKHDFSFVPGFNDGFPTSCSLIKRNNHNQWAYDCRSIEGANEGDSRSGNSQIANDAGNWIVVLGNGKTLDAEVHMGANYRYAISANGEYFEGCIKGAGRTPFLSTTRPDLYVPRTAWHCDYKVREQAMVETSLGANTLLSYGNTFKWLFNYARCANAIFEARKSKGISDFIANDCLRPPGPPFEPGTNVFNN